MRRFFSDKNVHNNTHKTTYYTTPTPSDLLHNPIYNHASNPSFFYMEIFMEE